MTSIEEKSIDKLNIITLNFEKFNGVNDNRIIYSLRRMITPRNLRNKIILVYTAKYNSSMSFLFAINSNFIGNAIANSISLDKISTTTSPLPTEEQPYKYILIPAPRHFSIDDGIWELFIGDEKDPSTHKQKLFASKQTLLNYYNTTPSAHVYPSNYIIHHNFSNSYITEGDFLLIRDMPLYETQHQYSIRANETAS